MKKLFKKLLFSLSFGTIIILNGKSVYASAYLLYETSKTETLSKDVTYTEIKQVTNLGLRDIYVLKVPTKDPNIKLDNTISGKKLDLKENVVKLLNGKGAIAGVNGDFFNMAGTYSNAQGPIVSEGKIIATDNLNNIHKDEYSALLLTKEGNPFIEYIKTDIDFLNNGAEYLKVHYFNKIPEMVYPVYLDRSAMTDTSSVDAKFPNVTKIVVENKVITYISKMGETVTIPENGYIICVAEASAEYQLSVVNVGEPAEIKAKSNVDYESLYTAIGGGGKLLVNGQAVEDGGLVISGRQPRTSVGISQDGNYIYLVVVDGRTHSIGASHYELASIMTRVGAYQAMHLDGGGSTTMAVQSFDETQVKLVNTPSQSNMRNVVNSLGVYDKSEQGELTQIKINFGSDKVMQGIGTPYKILGIDDYLNKVPFDVSAVNITSTDTAGRFENGMFYPSITGKIDISAELNGMTGKTQVQSLKLIQLVPAVNNIQTNVGEATPLNFDGKSVEGITRYLHDAVNYEVVPNDLGTIANNTFTATKQGTGYIKASVLDVVYYLDVAVGFKTAPLDSFETTDNIAFVAYPENITGKAYLAVEKVSHGTRSLALKYKFNTSSDTQAAYLQLNNKIKLEGNPKKITLQVAGDNSKNILKARLIDAQGTEHAITFTSEINWTDFKDVTASIPTNAVYPVYLDRIYVASLSNTDTAEHILYFDNLTGEISVGGKVEHPNNSVFYDVLRSDLGSLKLDNSFDFTLIGKSMNSKTEKPSDYLTAQEKLFGAVSANTTKALIAGDMDYTGTISAPILKWGRFYGFFEHNNVGVVYMNSSKGSFFASNLEQWQNFYNDIKTRNKKHIVIETDLNPLNSKSVKEFELFHDALVKLHADGINIFVVSTDGASTNSTVKDGIRYINMGGLFKNDNTINTDVRVLRFRVSGDKIFYDLQKVYN